MGVAATVPRHRAVLHDIARDEARFCAMLTRHIRRLGDVQRRGRVQDELDVVRLDHGLNRRRQLLRQLLDHIDTRQRDRLLDRVDLLVEALDLLDHRSVGLRRGLLFLAELAVAVRVELADRRRTLLLKLLELSALRLEGRADLVVGGLQRLRAGNGDGRVGHRDAVDLGSGGGGDKGGKRQHGGAENASFH